ncbi:MAG: hypothetical protein K2V38_17130, partial [Gemmataceae bacterium]|nr:hypothetical protein [Gemmataceae bacterium]
VTSWFAPWRAGEIHWSQFHRIEYDPHARALRIDRGGPQALESRADPPADDVPRALPFLFQRDVPAWKPFPRVLIIGDDSGTANEVSRALVWLEPDAHLDAVEPDRVVQRLGATRHPDQPFADPRVTAHIADGRHFLRTAPAETYDLVILIPPSPTGTNARHATFTLEAFGDVRRVLKPTGVCAVCGHFRQGWVVARMRDQLRAAFGEEPVVLTSDGAPVVMLGDNLTSPVALFAADSEVLNALRAAFEPADEGRPAGGLRDVLGLRPRALVRYWHPRRAALLRDTKTGFGIGPLPSAKGDGSSTGWIGVVPAEVEKTDLRPATDDWPFLFAPASRVPDQTWWVVGLTLTLTVGVWLAFGGWAGLTAVEASSGEPTPDFGGMARAFFLLVGVTLAAATGASELALLLGTAWAGNTATVAILAALLMGSAFAGRVKPGALYLHYAGLFAVLAIGLFVRLEWGAAVAGTLTPVGFAGVILAVTFGRAERRARVLGAAVAGVVVGRLAEGVVVVTGFKLLLLAAGGCYLLSAKFGGDEVPDGAAGPSV